MLRTNFYLRRPQSTKETPVFLRLFSRSKGIKYATRIQVLPTYWDKNKQRIKPVAKVENHLELNRYLDILKKVADKTFWDLTNESEGKPPSLSTLKLEIDKRLDRVEKEPVITFFEFFQRIIDQSEAGTRLNPLTGKVINPNTIKTYVTTLNHLQDFQKQFPVKITFDNIDLKFYNAFTEYLIKEKKLASNSVGKDIQVLKLILNEALDLHLTSNTSFKTKRFVVLREASDSIYLDKDELEELKNHHLSGVFNTIPDESSMGNLARELNITIGKFTIGRNNLYAHLRDFEILQDSPKNIPESHFFSLGYFYLKEYEINCRKFYRLVVTSKGIEWLKNEIVEKIKSAEIQYWTNYYPDHIHLLK